MVPMLKLVHWSASLGALRGGRWSTGMLTPSDIRRGGFFGERDGGDASTIVANRIDMRRFGIFVMSVTNKEKDNGCTTKF